MTSRSSNVALYVKPQRRESPMSEQEAARIRSGLPDDPIPLPSGHLACEGCGVAERGPVVAEIEPGEGWSPVQFTRCLDCQRLHELAPDRRTRSVLYALSVIGIQPPDDPAPLVPWMQVAASAVTWLDPEAPTSRLCSPHRWAHVSLGKRAQIKEAFLFALRSRAQQGTQAIYLTPPHGRACGFCGVGSVPLAPIEVARRGGREAAAHSIWREVLAAPEAFGGHGPDLVRGFLCPSCTEAADNEGAVGVLARARAFQRYADDHRSAVEAGRARRLIEGTDQITLPGWAALGTRRPNRAPWSHIVVPEPVPVPEVTL